MLDILFMYIILLQSMPIEQCARGTLPPLPTELQTSYQQLNAPQCTNITHINAFLVKLLTVNNGQIGEIFYHLQQATANLNHIHVS